MTDTRTPYGLVVRKVAGEDGMERVNRFDVLTGERYLASPIDGRPLPRPLLGVEWEFEAAPYDEPPELIEVPMRYAGREDWLELVNPRPVHKPGGPAEDPWRVAHTFTHADELVLHFLSGDYRYRVIHQPDKYDDETGEPSDNAGDPTTHVDWFYRAELVSAPGAEA